MPKPASGDSTIIRHSSPRTPAFAGVTARLTSPVGLAFVALLLSGFTVTGSALETPSRERQHEIMQMLRQDCGSCHGLTLKGGLGPALTPGALAGKPPALLRDTILQGRARTPMAPWRPFLNEAEAAWLVRRLQQGVSDAP